MSASADGGVSAETAMRTLRVVREPFTRDQRRLARRRAVDPEHDRAVLQHLARREGADQGHRGGRRTGHAHRDQAAVVVPRETREAVADPRHRDGLRLHAQAEREVDQGRRIAELVPVLLRELHEPEHPRPAERLRVAHQDRLEVAHHGPGLAVGARPARAARLPLEQLPDHAGVDAAGRDLVPEAPRRVRLRRDRAGRRSGLHHPAGEAAEERPLRPRPVGRDDRGHPVRGALDERRRQQIQARRDPALDAMEVLVGQRLPELPVGVDGLRLHGDDLGRRPAPPEPAADRLVRAGGLAEDTGRLSREVDVVAAVAAVPAQAGVAGRRPEAERQLGAADLLHQAGDPADARGHRRAPAVRAFAPLGRCFEPRVSSQITRKCVVPTAQRCEPDL